VLAVLISLAAPFAVAAADIRQGRDFTVGSGETVNDDVYIFGDTVDVAGTVNGSAILFGVTITVGGTVTRDLMVAGANVNVTGEVKGSIRMVGGTLTLNGPVGEDVVVAGGIVTLGPKATVGRDVLIGGQAVTISGPVGRKILAGSIDLTIAGPVGGDVQVDADTLRLESGAVINGSLRYWSNNEATMAPGAKVQGRIERHPARGRGHAPDLVSGFVGWLQTLVALMAVGLILVLLFPGFTGRATGALRGSPWASLGIGVGLLIGIPIAAFILFILGLFVGGWWLALLGVCGYVAALVVGYVFSALLAGQWILERLERSSIHPIWALLLGLVLLTVVGFVPILGGIIGFIAVGFGLGALALALVRTRRALAVKPVASLLGSLAF
jgi:cytoskeletal protein CcmA (bactofilin family)